MEAQKVLAGMLVLLLFMLSYYILPLMPEQMASHWDINGNVNGYMSRFWGIYSMPFAILLMFIAYLVLPKIDPKKDSYKSFKKEFDNFIAALFVFFAAMQLTIIAWNLGIEISIQKVTIIGIAALLYFSASLIGKAKQNWFVGIKTPWTLSDKEVWDKTHQLGEKLFKISAAIALIGAFAKGSIALLCFAPALAASIFLVAYSYILHKKKN